jgi:putative DNA primase/helicase
MKAKDIYLAGFTDLVSVIPPGATLSPNSKVAEESIGKAPGKKNSRGQWYGYNWQNEPCTERDAAYMDLHEANVGIKAGNYPAVDIDCTDPVVSDLIRSVVEKKIGKTPVRVGLAPKCLLMCRTDEPFSRMRIRFTYDRRQHLVEILGEGQQYVITGTHPKTNKPYTWDCEFTQTQLAYLNRETAEELLTEIEAELTTFGIECQRDGSGLLKVPGAANVSQDTLKAPDMKVLSEAVAAIPNNLADREEYIKFAYAVKAASQDDPERGWEIFWEWAERWEGGVNDESVVRGDWDRMQPPYEIGFDYVANVAKFYGFQDVVYEFQATAAPVEPDEKDIQGVYTSEIWLAQEFVDRYGGKLRWVPNWGKWACWDGKVWRADDLGMVATLARKCCTEIADAVARHGVTPQEQRQAMKDAKTISSARVVDAVVKLAKADRRILLSAEQFDTDVWQLGTPGGIVNLKTGELMAANPEANIAKITAVAPDTTNPATLWKRFVLEAAGGDRELADYLQRLAGYTLTGSVQEHTLAFLWGPGGNGKSVFVNTLIGILGDYAKIAPMETFTSSIHDRHPTELASLVGSRLVSSSETQEGRSWDEAKIKAITGGDKITARFMHRDFFTYDPQFKLIFLGNHKPEIRNLDAAMKRRFHLVPFTVTPAQVDKELPEKLKEEWGSILAWCVEGCLMWQRDGLAAPKAVMDATSEYFSDEDPIGRFLEDHYVVGQGQVLLKDMFDVWKEWCGENGEKAGTQKRLSQTIRSRGFLPWRQSKTGLRGFEGLTLKSTLRAAA